VRPTILRPDFLLFPFPGSARGYGANVTAALDGPRALLIDPGSPEQAAEVRDELAAHGAKVEAILLTHGHRDHAGGCAVFPRTPVHCGDVEKILAERHGPVRRLAEGDVVEWGRRRIGVYGTPGHTAGHLAIRIDADLLLIGCLMIYAGDGRPALPHQDGTGDAAALAADLRRLLEAPGGTVLPFHGAPIETGPRLEAEIAARLGYLDRLAELGPGAKLSECLADRGAFTHLHLHRLNGGRGG